MELNDELEYKIRYIYTRSSPAYDKRKYFLGPV